MSSSLQHTIEQLRQEITDFNRSDVLVDITPKSKKILFEPDYPEVEICSTLKKILFQAKEHQKTAGFNSLCWTKGIITIKLDDQEIHSPLFLFPVHFNQHRLSKNVHFKRNEIGIVNPFLVELFKNELHFVFSSNEIHWDEINEFLIQLKELKIQLDINFECLGNFHHHRYSAIRELEELVVQNDFSHPLCELLGDKKSEKFSFDWSNNFLLSSDSDHRKVVDVAMSENSVIQGPPGTGKSQVLVNLIGKSIEKRQKIALISEKYSALEVVQKRLQQVGLSKFSFIATQKSDRNKFIQELKNNWETLSHLDTPTPKPLLRISEQKANQLDFAIDLLRKKDIIGGISIREFLEISGEVDLKKKFIHWAPNISEFVENELIIKEIYDENLGVLGKIHPAVLKSDRLLELTTTIDRISVLLKNIQHLFDCNTIVEIQRKTKQSANLQLFEGEIYRKYNLIFRPDSKTQKKYFRLRKKFISMNEKIEKNTSDWKIQPNLLECENLTEILENGTFFQKRKAKKRWKEISNLEIQVAIERLKNWKNQLELQNEIKKIKQQFSEINIQNPAQEISIIDGAIHFFTKDKFKLFDQLSEEEKTKIGASHQQFEELNSLLKSYFILDENEDFQLIISKISNRLSCIVSCQPEFNNWSSELFKILTKTKTFEECRKTIFRSHWIQFRNRFPQFSIKNNEELQKCLDEILLLEKIEQVDFSQFIQAQVQQQFKEYSSLLSIPAHKLSQEKKELKKRLKKGKSILVKEFNKSRNHPSIRTLFSSEAREWIQLLKPIFLCNPSQMADAFPLEKELFDVVLFDEASQIILQDALGAAQRAKRIIVCGDDQQMQPTSYFSSTKPCVDLLHQANFYLKKIHLKHHYRSQNPALIAFSNRHFYNNELIAFPSKSKEKGIEWKKVYGIYTDGINEIEAKKVAKYISNKISKNRNIGIVAFSEKQLECIWKNLSVNNQAVLGQKIELGEAFFKTLENVQGDECDEIIISFGYGKDPEGNFAMRFGPMNFSTGRNRLNVLLTRAKQKITFFSSVDTKHFKITDNESIELLRNWFVHLENGNDLFENQTIDLSPERFNSSRDLITYYSVLKERKII